ncbi:MAG: hypothetical protein [Microviridae sp.]|nr:MAG: hypothetical protein [Microviridae sp.]
MSNAKKTMPSLLPDLCAEVAEEIKLGRKVVFNHYNSGSRLSKGFIFTQSSQTVPDQTMKISEIIRRFASGLPLGGQRVPLYEDEGEDMFEGVNPAKMDITEKMDIINARKDEYNAIQKRDADRKKQKEYPKKTVPPEGAEGAKDKKESPKGTKEDQADAGS